jgi:hypothetical protein
MEDAEGCNRILALLACLHELWSGSACTVHTPYITYTWDISFVILPKHSSFIPYIPCQLPGSGKHSKALHALCICTHMCTPVCGSVFTLTSIQRLYCLNIRFLSQEYIYILSTSCVAPRASPSLCVSTHTDYFNYSFMYQIFWLQFCNTTVVVVYWLWWW